MNKKAQAGVGMLIIVAIAVIVGAILLTTSAQNVGDVTNTVTLANSSFTLGAESNVVYLTNWKSISGAVVYNATGELVPAANYTIANNVVYNGAEAISITTSAVNSYANDSCNISGTVQPLTYSANSGSRSVAGLIVVFFALGIGVVALYPVLKNKSWR